MNARVVSLFVLVLAAAVSAAWLLPPLAADYGIEILSGPPPGPAFELIISAPAAGQGEVVGLRLAATGRYRTAETATARFSGLRLVDELQFYALEGEHRVLVPVSYAAEPGEYEFEVAVLDNRGEIHVLPGKLPVERRDYQVQRLTMTSQQMSVMSSPNLQSDREKVEAARARPSPTPLWHGPFLMPVEGRISTEFGVTRYVNGVLYSRHSGIDIAVAEGTPVSAGNSGVVVLADALIASGNSVIIDHGLGLFSAYNHLSRIDVRVGETVGRGQQIGAVGSTGFSTGPHLHYTLSVGPVATNPWPWFERDPLELFGGRPDPGGG